MARWTPPKAPGGKTPVRGYLPVPEAKVLPPQEHFEEDRPKDHYPCAWCSGWVPYGGGGPCHDPDGYGPCPRRTEADLQALWDEALKSL